MKNTLLKLIAVLALCFVIGGVLVACGGAGEAGADGQTPYIGENGNWWIGTTDTGVAAQGKPGADGNDATAVKCEHANVTEWTLVEHTLENDGKYLEVCDDCGYAWAIEEQRHDYVLKEEYVPETCTTASFKGYQCSICGDIDEENVEYKEGSEPLGHDWSAYSYVAAVGETVCADGGIKARHCNRCSIKESEAVAPTGHIVAEWDLVSDALLTKKGELKGACEFCGTKDVKFELPVLSETDYTVETVAATCSKGGTITYTLKNDEVKYSVVLNTLAAGHILNGQNYENYKVGGVIPYWVGGVSEFIKPFADAPFTCSDVAQPGHFTCEECEEIVPVNVLYSHNGATTVVSKPTCTVPGSMKVDCDNCEFNDAVAIPVTHSFEYTLVEGVLSGKCTKCDAPDEVQTGVVDYLDDPIVVPTCLNSGVVEYTYIYKVGAKYVIETRELSVPETSHTILHKGEYVLASKVANDDGTFNHNVQGIKAFAETPFTTCEQVYSGYYSCSVCKAAGADDIVEVQVVKVHVPAGEAVVVNPTCTTPGSETFACGDCQTPSVVNPIPALGHTDGTNEDGVAPKYELEANGTGWDLVTICSRTDCGVELDRTYYPEAEITTVTPASCKAAGVTKITVTLESGKELSFEGSLPKTAHTLNGLLVDSEEFAVNVKAPGVYYATTPGLINFADNEFVCETTVGGCYECESCEELVPVQVYQDHDYDHEALGAVKPTCTEPGSAPCTLCHENKPIAALGHTYTTTVSDLVAPTADVEGSFKFTAVCSVCDSATTGHEVSGEGVLPVLGTEGVYEVKKAAATCIRNGFDKYSYKYAKYNVTVTFEIEVEADGHATQLPTDRVIGFQIENNWYVVYVCSKCNEYVVIASGDAEIPEQYKNLF